MRSPRSASLLCLLAPLCLLSACQPESDTADTMPVTQLLGGSGGTDGFAVAEQGVAIELPADHGAHNAFRSEWWYFTAVLSDAEGAPFGVQFTIFRQALRPPLGAPPECDWCADHAWLGHVAITDVNGGRHEHLERLARGSPGLAGANAKPFSVWVDGLSATSVGAEFLPLRLDARSANVDIDLTLGPGGRLALQGDRGYSAKGPDQASHYFSITRLPVTGTLTVSQRTHQVTGHAWLDREWSTSVLSGGQRGWDWLALSLADGRDVMAFRLRRADTSRDPFDQAIIIDVRNQRRYTPEQFALEPTRVWRDERGAAWPVGWRLQIADEVLHIDAMLDDQLMRTMVRYWEGLVRVSDADGTEIGRGYLELTGYERDAAKQDE